jgi:DNA repair protein RecN (Recombination protein N)
MLSLLKINNIALIDELSVEFADGLNLLTGETGSGKSIIVDSLGALCGSRVSVDLIKEGEEKALLEGLLNGAADPALLAILESAGIEHGTGDEFDLIIRRELASNGRNRVFINNQLVTQGLLKEIGQYLADIHGQGEQATLFDPERHVGLLDAFAGVEPELKLVREKFAILSKTRRSINALRDDDAKKLQMLDILRFQTDEISHVNISAGEDDELEAEKKRLANVERISTLSDEAYGLLYDNDDAVIARLDLVSKLVGGLQEFQKGFGEYTEGIESAQAVLEELAISVRDFRNSVEFSPTRLEEIENRLAEIGPLKRKYGGTIATVLAHYKNSKERLQNIETAEEKEKQLLADLDLQLSAYKNAAGKLNAKRKKAAGKFEELVISHCASLALEKAVFEINFDQRDSSAYAPDGFDEIEFYFSANPGEPPKPLAKVASGGEASRLMLILKTASKIASGGKAVVFDEVDAGVGGRVAEAVGFKLKSLSGSQQILCVTHQPQIASLADKHYLVEKSDDGKRTTVSIRKLDESQRLEEIARMLAGETITEAARENAKAMLNASA